MDRSGEPALISRPDALRQGFRYYFTGKACPAGHVTLRFVSNRHCKACINVIRTRADRLRPHLRAARVKRSRERRCDYRVSEDAARRARWSLNFWERDAIACYYWLARSLTRRTGVVHQVDHIYPINGENSCGLHVLSNLQILTRKANIQKSNKNPEINTLPEAPPSDYSHEPQIWEDRWLRAN